MIRFAVRGYVSSLATQVTETEVKNKLGSSTLVKGGYTFL